DASGVRAKGPSMVVQPRRQAAVLPQAQDVQGCRQDHRVISQSRHQSGVGSFETIDMRKLYILGGRERKLLLNQKRPDWSWYESALILEVDTESGEVWPCVTYETPI